MGLMYKNGEGIPQNDTEAAKWFKIVAEKGNADAQYNMGIMHYFGKGVPQNNVLAYQWFEIAYTSGFDSARKTRDEIAQLMSVDDTSKAQKMAKTCINSNYQDCGY